MKGLLLLLICIFLSACSGHQVTSSISLKEADYEIKTRESVHYNQCIPGYFDRSQAYLDAVRGTAEYYEQQRCPMK